MKINFSLTEFISFGFEFMGWCNVCEDIQVLALWIPICGFRLCWSYTYSEKYKKTYRRLSFNCWLGFETRSGRLMKHYRKEFGKKIDWDDI